MSADAARRDRPRRLNRLWLLAAILGVGTGHLMMTIVHDTSRQRDAVHLIAQSVADQMVSQMETRVELLGARGMAIRDDSAMIMDSVLAPVLRTVTATNTRFVEFDSGSVILANRDSSVTLGTLHEDHHYFGMAPARGVLREWRVIVALQRGQVSPSLVAPVPDDRLWLLGVFGLLTIATLVYAVGSSQRELLLARARSDFVAGVSHELRMPLAQILLAGETLALQRDRTDAERSGLSRSIVREARRLMAIVDNVLFFSRSDAARTHVRMQPVRVASLFENVVESVDLAVADAGQSIDAGATADLAVLADADLARHALVNLVDNAIKYGKRGQRITLSAERSANNRVLLHVDDEGPGIPAAERARVFDAYERLARDQVSERTGTGLGLAIVRRIAEACGGRVWIDTAPSGGARATLELGAAQ